MGNLVTYVVCNAFASTTTQDDNKKTTNISSKIRDGMVVPQATGRDTNRIVCIICRPYKPGQWRQIPISRARIARTSLERGDERAALRLVPSSTLAVGRRSWYGWPAPLHAPFWTAPRCEEPPDSGIAGMGDGEREPRKRANMRTRFRIRSAALCRIQVPSRLDCPSLTVHRVDYLCADLIVHVHLAIAL
jgi:hypothetical protein